jgi:large subunit ribosomal protein L10
MSKKVKALELDALRKSVAGVKDFVLIQPEKVDSATDYEFRKVLRGKQVKVQLVKNTYAKKVFGENGVNLADGTWGGPTLVCWGGKNIKDLSNVVDDQIKASKKDPKAPDKFKVKTAVADGQAVTMAAAKLMPTREEAIADILACVLAPGADLVAALTGPATAIAGILKAIEEKKPDEAAAPAAAG